MNPRNPPDDPPRVSDLGSKAEPEPAVEATIEPYGGGLLAVDLGLRLGLAVYGRDGRLREYRSHNVGSTKRLRRAAPRILDELPGLAVLVAEGDRSLYETWSREALRRELAIYHVAAETWRERLLLPRERRRTKLAKEAADRRARAVIEWSGAPRPTSLRHDAAEAIMIGLWAVLRLGWLERLPAELR